MVTAWAGSTLALLVVRVTLYLRRGALRSRPGYGKDPAAKSSKLVQPQSGRSSSSGFWQIYRRAGVATGTDPPVRARGDRRRGEAPDRSQGRAWVR